MPWSISLYYSCVSFIMSNYLMPLVQQKALILSNYTLWGKKKKYFQHWTMIYMQCQISFIFTFFLFALLFPKSSQKDCHVFILLGFPPYDCSHIHSFQFWSSLKYPEKIFDLKDMKEKISFSHSYEFPSLNRFKTPRTWIKNFFTILLL